MSSEPSSPSGGKAKGNGSLAKVTYPVTYGKMGIFGETERLRETGAAPPGKAK